MIPRITLSPSLTRPGGIRRAVETHIQDEMNIAMRGLEAALRVQSPRDLGGHARGYRVVLFEFRNDDLFGQLVNDVANSLFRERGRPPGRQPPVAALEGWARRKGLSAYLVARKIGEKGTDRWIENRNPLGIDRDSQVGAIIVNNDSIIYVYLDDGIDRANRFEF
ncbi:MAG: hypothetical protein AAF773_00740 [Cyanobacteria bacterium P01_D01_bin.115]